MLDGFSSGMVGLGTNCFFPVSIMQTYKVQVTKGEGRGVLHFGKA